MAEGALRREPHPTWVEGSTRMLAGARPEWHWHGTASMRTVAGDLQLPLRLWQLSSRAYGESESQYTPADTRRTCRAPPGTRKPGRVADQANDNGCQMRPRFVLKPFRSSASLRTSRPSIRWARQNEIFPRWPATPSPKTPSRKTTCSSGTVPKVSSNQQRPPRRGRASEHCCG